MLDDAVRRFPRDAFAIDPDVGSTLSRRELRNRSKTVAGAISQLGIGRGARVAYRLDNGIAAVEVLLGILYGGFVAVPLPPRDRAGQLVGYLDSSETTLVVTDQKHRVTTQQAAVKAARPPHVLTVDCIDFESARPGTSLARGDSEDEAILFFTSGSTGPPKGVMLTHRNIEAGTRNSVLAHELSALDRSLCLMPLHHVNAFLVTLMPSLVTGGSVVVPSGFDAGAFWPLIGKWRCTWSAINPVFVSALLRTPRPEEEPVDRNSHSHLRFVRSSAARLAPKLHRQFEEKWGVLLIESMGCTEAGGTVFSNPPSRGGRKIGSPGRPWGFEVMIEKEAGDVGAPGESGELLIRGPAVMKGYLSDDTATRAALRTDGWLCTGDIAHLDEEGYLFIEGRKTDFMRRRGSRFLPSEIDCLLTEQGGVIESATVGGRGQSGDQVWTYVVGETEHDWTSHRVIELVRAHIGPTRVPDVVKFVPSLPKTPAGKILRHELGQS